MAQHPQGRLVLCPTPVGNLEDITLRALRTLRESDVIFAEDTRVTATLLRRYDIATPLRSFHQRSQTRRLNELRALLSSGKAIAAVSDAGMPGISDPGVELVRAARQAGARVEALPGPNSLLGALVLSGFDVSRFLFEGFAARKPGERRAQVQRCVGEPAAVLWLEAPSRIRALLGDIAGVVPQRRLFVLREYTKKFEQHIAGTAKEVLDQLDPQPRGEFTLVLEGERAPSSSPRGDLRAAMKLLRQAGISARDAADAIKFATGAPRNQLYRLALDAQHD